MIFYGKLLIMASRKIIFSNNEIYHVYNKTIDHRNIFVEQPLMNLFKQLLWYYRTKNQSLRYSYYHKLEPESKKSYWEINSARNKYQIELLAYVLMPNHFHLLVKQKQKNGIVQYLSQVLNSFTKAYNTFHNRLGPIFLPRFKAKIILSEEQLIHTSRYIHLNPYSSEIIEDINSLKMYQFSSLPEYLNTAKFCQTDTVLSFFNSKPTNYWQFLLDNAQHQKTLEIIKHFRA